MLQIWRGSWGDLTCDAHTYVHAYVQNYCEWRQDMARFAGTRERWMLLCLGHRNRRPVSAPVCVHLVEQSATIANESSLTRAVVNFLFGGPCPAAADGTMIRVGACVPAKIVAPWSPSSKRESTRDSHLSRGANVDSGCAHFFLASSLIIFGS